MFSSFIGVLGAIIVFGAIVTVHEFGHFIMAKLNKMTVYEFSIGFGPAIIKFTYHKTLYALRIIPVGGYVRIAGMDLGEEDSPNGYDKKPFFAKFVTLFAGAFMNFVLAFAVFIAIGVSFGYNKEHTPPIIKSVLPKTPAFMQGLKVGDRITAVDNTPVSDIESATKRVLSGKGDVVLRIERRDGVTNKELSITLSPMLEKGMERRGLRLHFIPVRRIGIQWLSVTEHLGPVKSIETGFAEVTDRTLLVLASLNSLIHGDVPISGIGGPLMIGKIAFSQSQEAVSSKNGMIEYLGLLAFISVNVGFMNLLPVPALDGGHLFFLLLGAIRRKPIDREKEAMIHSIGLMVLLGLMVLITIKDVFTFFGPQK